MYVIALQPQRIDLDQDDVDIDIQLAGELMHVIAAADLDKQRQRRQRPRCSLSSLVYGNACHAPDSMNKKQAVFLFESTWKEKYSDRGVRKILVKYSEEAGLVQNISPHKLRHFLLTWLKKQGIDDALIGVAPAFPTKFVSRIFVSLGLSKRLSPYRP